MPAGPARPADAGSVQGPTTVSTPTTQPVNHPTVYTGTMSGVAPAKTGDAAGLEAMKQSPLWSKLTSITQQKMPGWDDNVVYARAFSEAFNVAKALVEKGFSNPMQARELVNELMNLMPPSMQWDAAFGRNGMKEPAMRLFNPLPKAITDRYPDFQLKAGDLPKPGPAFAALDQSRAALSSAIFKDGQPGVFFGPDNRLVKIDRVVEEGGQKIALCTALPQHRYSVEHDGFRQQEQQRPAQGGLRIPVSQLEQRVFGQSPEASYNLNPASAEDRMIALVYSSELKGATLELNGQKKTVFEWIESAGPNISAGDLRQIQTAAQDAATRAIGKYAAHPRRIHFKIDTSQDWGKQCLELLGNCTGSSGSRYTQQRLGGNQSGIDERNWTSTFLGARDSFITGNANCYGSGEMRAKLTNGMLRPLGIWPDGTAVSNDTHGAFFERFATPNPQTGTIELSEPLHVKMNERTWHYPAAIGIGLGQQHGGRFVLHEGGGTFDPKTSAASYDTFAKGSAP